MKKLIVVLSFMVLGFNTYSQVGLDENLTYINKEYSGGELMSNPSGGYLYMYKSTDMQAYLVFLLDSKLVCYGTIVKPMSSLSLKYWKDNLSEKWVQINRKTWQLIRYDKKIAKCAISKDNEGKKVLLFTIN
tara:strand:- start:226 stop:621 length:396 start_codon:yes stop_codon:yes gene_type:complete